MLVAVLLRNHNGAATSAPPSAGSTRGSAPRRSSADDAVDALCDCPTETSNLPPGPANPAPTSPRCTPSVSGLAHTGFNGALDSVSKQAGASGTQRVSCTLAWAVMPGLVVKCTPAPAEWDWLSSGVAVGMVGAAWPVAVTESVLPSRCHSGADAVPFLACAGCCSAGITGMVVVWPDRK